MSLQILRPPRSNPKPHNSVSGTRLHALSGQERLEELLTTTAAAASTLTRGGAARPVPLPASVRPLLVRPTPREWWEAASLLGFRDREEQRSWQCAVEAVNGCSVSWKTNGSKKRGSVHVWKCWPLRFLFQGSPDETFARPKVSFCELCRHVSDSLLAVQIRTELDKKKRDTF